MAMISDIDKPRSEREIDTDEVMSAIHGGHL